MNATSVVLEKVFKRNDSFQTAVFVDYKTKVSFCLLHLAQHIFKARSINYKERRLQY